MQTNPVEFDLVSGLIVVTAAVNGTPVRFVVDTGASRTILTTSTTERLDLAPPNTSPKKAIGACGSTAAVPIPVRSFTWGHVSLSEITVFQMALDQVCGLADPSIGGIIGSDVLSRYRFTVDYPKRLISLE